MNFKKQEKKIFIVFVSTIVFYSLFVIFADIKKIIAVASKFNFLILPFLLLIISFNYLIRGYRFFYLLKKIKINLKFKEASIIFLSGLSMTITPGKSGEIIKAYLIKKKTGNRFSEMIPLLIIERLTDGVAMIILGLGGVYFFKNSLIFLSLSSLSVLIFIVFIKLKKQIIALIKKFEKKFHHFKVLDFFLVFFTNSQKLLTTLIFIKATLLGIFAWFFEGLVLYLITSQFTSIGFLQGITLSLFIFSFSSIAGFFAFIPGGIGVAEGSITYFLTSLLRLNLPQAIFITLIFRFVTLWFGVGFGLLSLIKVLHKNYNHRKK